VSEILEIEARALAAEESAAFERYWQIRDKLAGYARVEPAKLGDIGEDIAKGLNRQKRLARENLLLLETAAGWISSIRSRPAARRLGATMASASQSMPPPASWSPGNEVGPFTAR
jgi:hypothetical protein